MIGKTIGNYKVLSELGVGGMGTVYLAEHITLGTKVAIKALHPHLIKSPSIKTRFLKEAKMQAILDHKGITKVIDFVDNENGLFIILEYIEGESLDSFLFNTKGLLPENEANVFMVKILNAVEYAHSKDIVHRDLKSANIMITPDKNIKIMDFGIAKLAGDNLGLTKIGTKLGSPLYMSPEQVKGGNVDFRSDIYSLGVIYHEMLTGKPVYDQHTTSEFDIYDKIIKQPLPRLKTFYKLISDHAQELVDKATNKLPENRFQSCNEFAMAINNEKRITPSAKTKTSSSFPVTPIVIGVLLVLLLLIGGVLFMGKSNDDIEKMVQNADSFYQRKDYKKAISLYEEILKKDSKNNSVKVKYDELKKVSLNYEKQQVEDIIRKYVDINSLQEFNKDVVWKNKLIENYSNIKGDLLKLDDDPQITSKAILNQEKSNLEASNSYFNSLTFFDQGNFKQAQSIINEISNIEQYPEIESYKNLLNEKLGKLNIANNDFNEILTIETCGIVPILNNCKSNDIDQLKKCFEQTVYNHLKSRMNEKSMSNLGVKSKINIPYSFVIDKNGNITDIESKSSNARLNVIIKEVINTLKVIKPASLNGTNVSITYKSTFQYKPIDSEKDMEIIKETETPKKVTIPSSLSIQMVDKAPVFPGCEGKNGIELINCTSNKINNFISKNNHVEGKNIPAGKYTAIIHFKINNTGSVEQITVQTENEILRNEISRVVKSLPIMTPAIYQDIQVAIYYRLTLNVNVSVE